LFSRKKNYIFVGNLTSAKTTIPNWEQNNLNAYKKIFETVWTFGSPLCGGMQ
jgi:hypothetical protein